MARKKKIKELEDTIPEVQKKIVNIMEQQVELLAAKEVLSSDDLKNLIACSTTLSTLYKDKRQELVEARKTMKQLSKEELLQIVKTEGTN